MHPRFDPRQSDGPRDQYDASNQGGSNVNNWRMPMMHSVPPPGNFGGPNFNPAFPPPPVFAPPFPSAQFLPPPNFPPELNASSLSVFRPSDGNLPPPPPTVQGPSSFPLPPLFDQGEGFKTGLQSKSITEWLKSKSFRKFADVPRQKQSFKIREYRLRLETCILNTKKLDVLTSTAKSHLENLNEEKWEEMCHVIQLLKENIESNQKYLNDPRVLKSVKTQLEKRSKKRARLRRRNAEYREEKMKQENERKMVNQQIDDWMRTQEEKAANVKRDEQLKKEAQIVLSEVTRRTTEANRQLELLAGLEKLRMLKSQLPQSQGDAKTFDSFIVFENLKKMWSSKLKEYELEEQGLKVMLSEESIKSNKSLEKEALTKWRQLLFGKEDSHQFYTNFNELLLIRNQWDKFVVPNSDVGFGEVSSLIPIGWVLPSAASSAAWKQLLGDQ